jgi:hypothetical protein
LTGLVVARRIDMESSVNSLIADLSAVLPIFGKRKVCVTLPPGAIF